MKIAKLILVYVWLDKLGYHARIDGILCRETATAYERLDGLKQDIKISDLMKVKPATTDKKYQVGYYAICLLKDEVDMLKKIKKHIQNTLIEQRKQLDLLTAKKDSDFVGIDGDYSDITNVKIS